MASVFWNTKGILLIDCLRKGRTITREYYPSLLEKLKTGIAEKRPRMVKKRVLFHHDNASVHSSCIAQQKLTDLRFKLLQVFLLLINKK